MFANYFGVLGVYALWIIMHVLQGSAKGLDVAVLSRSRQAGEGGEWRWLQDNFDIRGLDGTKVGLATMTIPLSKEQNFQIFAINAMDSIWMLRNKVVHDQTLISNVDNFVSGTLKIYKEYCNAWDSKKVNESY